MSDPSDDLIMLAMSGIMIPNGSIPSRGDRVRINPEFTKYWTRCRGSGIPMPAHQSEPDASMLINRMEAFTLEWVLTVKRVVATHHDPVQALTLVEFDEIPISIWIDPAGRYDACRRCCSEYSIDPCPFKDRKGEPFFVLDGMSAHELKVKNTAPGAIYCAKCGTPLKNVGWHAMQHCPQCEP